MSNFLFVIMSDFSFEKMQLALNSIRQKSKNLLKLQTNKKKSFWQEGTHSNTFLTLRYRCIVCTTKIYLYIIECRTDRKVSDISTNILDPVYAASKCLQTKRLLQFGSMRCHPIRFVQRWLLIFHLFNGSLVVDLTLK